MIIKPLVSIIIPVYNCEKFLECCVKSVLSQSWPEKEIIIVNDGSTDNSLKIAERINFREIRIINQQKSGAAAARNTGLRYARGKYIQFLDADDLLSEDKIEQQVMSLYGSEELVAVCSTVHFYRLDTHLENLPSPYDERFLFTTNKPFEFLINLWGGNNGRGSMVQPNAWLTPRKLIEKAGNWNEELSVDDDGEFFARVLLLSKGIVRTKGLNYYRKYQNGSNLSSSNDYKALQSLLKASLAKKEELLSRCSTDAAKRAIDRLLTDVSVLAYLKYPDLVNLAEANYCGVRKINPDLGGEVINFLSKALGWKFAKRIQHLKNIIIQRPIDEI